MMQPEDQQALFAAVRAAVETYGKRRVVDAIGAAHMGRLDGYVVTDANLYLFRQYRNRVSPDARRMVREAMA